VWVVKLGGSLAHHPALRTWTSALAASSEKIIIVPGGGPFADEVRRLQQTWRFDDVRAHTLALRAMEQFGQVLCALHPGLRPLESLNAWNPKTQRQSTWVWAPSRDVLADSSIEASWDVTSDSIAAWLARRVKARGLLLVKSATPGTKDTRLTTLVSEGLVDRAFLRYGPRTECPIGILHRDRVDQVGGWLHSRPGYGHVIDITLPEAD